MNYITVVVLCLAGMAMTLLMHLYESDHQHPDAPAPSGISQVACTHSVNAVGPIAAANCN